MAVKIISTSRFNGGISVGDKDAVTTDANPNGLNSSFRFGYGANIRDEPSKWSSLPAPANVLSGSYGTGPLMTDEPRWFVSARPYASATFMYGSSGNIYREDSSGKWTLARSVPSSVGQGMCVYQNYLYYVQDTQIGRYGPLDQTAAPTWNDAWQTGLNPTSALGFAPCLVFGFGMAVGHGSSVGFYGANINISFSAYVNYAAGQVVGYAGQYWTCILSYTSSTTAPNADSTHWQVYQASSPPQQWTSAAITLPSGTSCRSFCRIEQYLAIGTVGSKSVFDNETGYVFMWDGSSPQWNFFNNIEQGGNNAIANYRNQPFSVNGSQGAIYLGFDPFQKVHQLPRIPITSRVEVYPGAITSWKGCVYVGFGANSSDTSFVRGVYAWGSKVSAYPDALSCDFLISTGNRGATVQVTACLGSGNSMYVGWRDGNAVGVDKVTYSNAPQPSARVDWMIFDAGRLPQQTKADTVQVVHSPLRPGESVSIYYRPDRADLPGYPFDTVPVHTHSYSANDLEPNITRWSPWTGDKNRFNELELGFSVGCGATSPYVYGLTLKYDDLANESSI